MLLDPSHNTGHLLGHLVEGKREEDRTSRTRADASIEARLSKKSSAYRSLCVPVESGLLPLQRCSRRGILSAKRASTFIRLVSYPGKSPSSGMRVVVTSCRASPSLASVRLGGLACGRFQRADSRVPPHRYPIELRGRPSQRLLGRSQAGRFDGDDHGLDRLVFADRPFGHLRKLEAQKELPDHATRLQEAIELEPATLGSRSRRACAPPAEIGSPSYTITPDRPCLRQKPTGAKPTSFQGHLWHQGSILKDQRSLW